MKYGNGGLHKIHYGNFFLNRLWCNVKHSLQGSWDG